MRLYLSVGVTNTTVANVSEASFRLLGFNNLQSGFTLQPACIADMSPRLWLTHEDMIKSTIRGYSFTLEILIFELIATRWNTRWNIGWTIRWITHDRLPDVNYTAEYTV